MTRNYCAWCIASVALIAGKSGQSLSAFAAQLTCLNRPLPFVAAPIASAATLQPKPSVMAGGVPPPPPFLRAVHAANGSNAIVASETPQLLRLVSPVITSHAVPSVAPAAQTASSRLFGRRSGDGAAHNPKGTAAAATGRGVSFISNAASSQSASGGEPVSNLLYLIHPLAELYH